MDKNYIEKVLTDGMNAMTRIDAENEFIEGLCAAVEEKEGIKAAKVKKWIVAAHKDDVNDKIAKLEELQRELQEFKLA